MRKLILTLFFVSVLLSNDVFAQKEGVIHPLFRALLQSGERIEGRNGYFTSTTFNGVLNTGQDISISRNDIRLLDVSEGSKVVQYTLIGAGVGLLISGTAIVMAASEAAGDQYKELNTGAIIPVTLSVTAISAFVGGIIGANQIKWTRVPIKTTFMFDPKEERTKLAISIPFN